MQAPDEDHAALAYAGEHDDASLCTIVGIDGTFSRRLGAQLAVGADGTVVGSLADGCLERELSSQASALQGAAPSVLRFGKGSPFIDFRLPCGSGLDVLVDPSPDSGAVRHALAELAARRTAELRLPVPVGTHLAARRYVPPIRILAFGSGPETDWLCRLAEGAGYYCQVTEPGRGVSLGQSPIGLTADRWTAVSLLFHDHEWERGILDWALSTEAFFIGAIGGYTTRAKRRDVLRQLGWDESALARVRGPVGLIPQARDARVLGLSILAEIVNEYECLRREVVV